MTIPVHFVGSIALDTPGEVFDLADSSAQANENLAPAVSSGVGIGR